MPVIQRVKCLCFKCSQYYVRKLWFLKVSCKNFLFPYETFLNTVPFRIVQDYVSTASLWFKYYVHPWRKHQSFKMKQITSKIRKIFSPRNERSQWRQAIRRQAVHAATIISRNNYSPNDPFSITRFNSKRLLIDYLDGKWNTLVGWSHRQWGFYRLIKNTWQRRAWKRKKKGNEGVQSCGRIHHPPSGGALTNVDEGSY